MLWAVSLLRQCPSVLKLTGVVVVLIWVLWPVFEALPSVVPIRPGVAAFIGVHATVVRSYTTVVAVDVLQGTDRSARQRFADAWQRLPAVVAITVAIVLGAGVAVWALEVLGWAVTTLVSPAGLQGSLVTEWSAAVVSGVVPSVAVYKFWLAPEVCVAGGYGPLTALRVSWATTRLHWLRTLGIVVGITAVSFLPAASRQALLAIGWDWALWGPLFGMWQFALFGVGYAVWYGVATQVYVDAVLTSDGQNGF